MSVVIAYCLCFNLYIYELTHKDWDVHYVKLFYNYVTVLMVIYYLIDRKDGFVGFFHKQFNKVCIHCVIINYFIIIFNRHGWLIDAAKMFYCFNIATGVATVMFLTNGIWLKLLKYEC